MSGMLMLYAGGDGLGSWCADLGEVYIRLDELRHAAAHDLVLCNKRDCRSTIGDNSSAGG